MKSSIAFATLFLGLTLGPYPVEVLVSQDVASVEILLDGRPVARLQGPPWKEFCNLGEELTPSSLEAVAYGKDGEELGRTRQWLNIPRPPAQGRILLENDAATGLVTARFSSTSIRQEVPTSVSVQFDGTALPWDPERDPNSVVLPAHDPEQLHYLRVSFEFEEGLSSTVERIFGGGFADQVGAELTAVPVQFDKGAAEPESAGWLEALGEGLSVVDVVEGPVEIVIVRDQSAQADIDRMVRRGPGDVRAVGSLKKGYSVTMMNPYADQLKRTDTDLRLFRLSSRLTAFDGGMFWLMAAVRAPVLPLELQRLSDALAVAGLSAAADGHRRAVVLVLGSEPADHGRFAPQVVRKYLKTMRVPLFVWSTTGARATPWGIAEDASSITKIERRTKEMVKTLERQRIAWVRGFYLPPEITVAASRTDIRLAGS